mgnify:CR=1 FL=1
MHPFTRITLGSMNARDLHAAQHQAAAFGEGMRVEAGAMRAMAQADLAAMRADTRARVAELYADIPIEVEALFEVGD